MLVLHCTYIKGGLESPSGIFVIITGEHLHHHSLPYNPPPYHAITCNAHHIMVLQRGPATLRLHTWDGERVQSVTREELGVKEYGRAVKWVEDDKLILYAGEYPHYSLHAYKVMMTTYLLHIIVNHMITYETTHLI